MNIRALVAVLSTSMKEAGLNQKSLAVKAGLNDTAVRDILKGRSKNPKLDTLHRLARALDFSFEEFARAIDLDDVGRRAEAAAAPASKREPVVVLEDLLDRKGLTIKDLSGMTKLTQRRLQAIADGAEVRQDELNRIAAALDLGVFDIFDFTPITREEVEFVVDLRRVGSGNRTTIRAMLDAMKGLAANDQKAAAAKAPRKKSA